MGLEFIDISREEEREGARANGTTGRRRTSGGGRPQPVRREASRTIRYEKISSESEGYTRKHSGKNSVSNKNRIGDKNSISDRNRIGERNPINDRNRVSSRNRMESRVHNQHNDINLYDIGGRAGNANRNREYNYNKGSSRNGSRNYNYNSSQNRSGVRRPRPVDPKAQQERMRRRKIRKRKAIAARMTVMTALILVIVLAVFMLYKLITDFSKKEGTQETFNSFTPTVERREVIRANEAGKPVITEDFLTVNEYSRPGEKLGKVRNIFVHYTANPGTSAAQNRSYFENLGITGETSASAHFVIGYEGEIIQCIPLEEIAYAVVQRNYDSISIECCYLAEDGKFTDETYQSLLRLSAWLLNEYNLAPDDMRRHYDEGGKKCPLYYVEHEDAWEEFLSDLERYIMNNQA